MKTSALAYRMMSCLVLRFIDDADGRRLLRIILFLSEVGSCCKEAFRLFCCMISNLPVWRVMRIRGT